MRVTLNEARPVTEALTVAEGPGRFLVQLITPGRGSSGYYSAETLQQAARDRIWPAGTHMYIDHPSESEQYDRPERTIRDLAAVLTEDARWDTSLGALVAEARVFSTWRTAIAEMLEDIGVSIRAYAEAEIGDVDGTKAQVITRLTEGISVDFVTHAGRGGKVLAVLESRRAHVQEARNVGQWVESRIHRDFTVMADEMFGDGRLTRDERIALSSAIGDALAAFVAKVETVAPQLYDRDVWEPAPDASTSAVEAAKARGVAEATANDRRDQLDALVKDAYGGQDVWPWVRDFDDSTVWFEISGGDQGGIFQQAYAVTNDVATALTGTRTEVRVQTTYVPVDAAPAAADEAASLPTSPAGQSTATESQEDTMATTQIEESRLAQLETDAGRATALESERAAAIERAEKAEAKLAAVETRAKLRPVVSQVIDASETMPAAMKARVINATVEALGADATEDTAKAAAEAARTAGETEAAEIAEAFGVGTPRGLGGTTTPPGDGKGISESEFADVLGLNIKEA